MDGKEMIYYGFGQIILSLALIDGKIQREEEESLNNIIEKAHKDNLIEMDLTGIIFKIQKFENAFTPTEIFLMGIKNIKLGDNHLTPQLLKNFTTILNSIAEAFPPKTNEELNIVNRFENSFKYIH
jgi:hypothetical protein